MGEAMTSIASDELRRQLVGAWRLVSWQLIDDDGSIDHPLGSDAIGQLMYTESGHVSAQLVRANQAPFASDDWQRASPAEMVAAWPGYFGYFGTFSVDPERGVVTHHVQAGWFPNLAGTEQVRHYRFEEGLLVLDASTAWGEVRIVWQKAAHQ